MSITTLSAQNPSTEVEQDSVLTPVNESKFETLFFKAIAERGIENYEKAINTLSILEDEFKVQTSVLFQLGLNHYDLKQYELALSYFEKYKRAKPNTFEVDEFIYEIYKQQGNFTKAIEVAENLFIEKKEYIDVLVELYSKTEQYDKALSSLDKSDDLFGYDPIKDNLRVEIFKNKDPNKAINYYMNRQKLETYNPLIDYRLIQFLMSDNQLETALSQSETALTTHPRFSRFFVLQTKIYTELDQGQNALIALKNVVSDRFLDEKYKVQAIEVFKNYLSTHQEYQDDFIALLNQASETAVDNSSFVDLGLFYFDKDKIKSLENFKKALTQNPQDFEILKNIAVLEYQLKQTENAIKTANKALDIYPTQAVFMLIKGEAYIELTQYNEAKSVLLEALSYVFEEDEMLLNIYKSLGYTYDKLSDNYKALEYNTKAKTLETKFN